MLDLEEWRSDRSNLKLLSYFFLLLDTGFGSNIDRELDFVLDSCPEYAFDD